MRLLYITKYHVNYKTPCLSGQKDIAGHASGDLGVVDESLTNLTCDVAELAHLNTRTSGTSR